MGNDRIQTRTITTRLDEEGIIRIVARPVPSQDVSDAQQNLDAIDLIRQGRKRPASVDLREAISTEHRGRRLYSRKELDQSIRAAARMVKSPISRVIGSLFAGLNKPPFPLAVFNSEQESVEWLRRYLNE